MMSRNFGFSLSGRSVLSSALFKSEQFGKRFSKLKPQLSDNFCHYLAGRVIMCGWLESRADSDFYPACHRHVPPLSHGGVMYCTRVTYAVLTGAGTLYSQRHQRQHLSLLQTLLSFSAAAPAGATTGSRTRRYNGDSSSRISIRRTDAYVS